MKIKLIEREDFINNIVVKEMEMPKEFRHLSINIVTWNGKTYLYSGYDDCFDSDIEVAYCYLHTVIPLED